MATAGSVTVSSSETIIYNSVDGCSKFLVACLSTSINDVLVNIPGLHDSDEYITIETNKEYVFSLGKVGIKKVIAKGDGGNADITYGVVEIAL